MSQKRCVKCEGKVYTLGNYYCCGKSGDVCNNCAKIPCNQCEQPSGIVRRPYGKKKQEKQINQKPYSSRYQKQSIFRDILKSCSRCSQTIYSIYISFQQPQCRIHYCYRCIYSIFNNFKADIKTPQIPVELPCGCLCSQQKIILFLKSGCYCCSKVIDTKFFSMKNGARIKEYCYQTRRNKVLQRYHTQSDFLAFQQLEELMLRCSGCTDLMQEIGQQMDDLYLCKNCLRQMEAAQSQIKNYKQSHILSKKQKVQIKSQKKKECSICSRLFPLTQDSLDICQFCIDDLQQGNRQVIDSEEKGKKKQDQVKLVDRKGEDKGDKYSTEILVDYSDNTEEMKKFQKDQNKNEIKDMQVQILEEKAIGKEKVIEKREEMRDQLEDEQCLQPAQTYFMKQIYQEQQQVLECTQCLVGFPVSQLVYTFQKGQSNQASIRIIENELQLSRVSSGQKITKYYCQLCYFTLKYSLLQAKGEIKTKKQNLFGTNYQSYQQPSLFSSGNQRLASSTFYTPTKDGIFEKKHFDEQESKYLFKSERKGNKCINCSKEMSVLEFKEKCIDCRNKQQRQSMLKCRECSGKIQQFDINYSSKCENCRRKQARKKQLEEANQCIQCGNQVKYSYSKNDTCDQCRIKKRKKSQALQICKNCRKEKRIKERGLCEYCTYLVKGKIT